jgi:hypothetical protein
VRGAYDTVEQDSDIETSVDSEQQKQLSLFAQFQEAALELSENPTGQYVIAAASFKKMADYALSLF